MLVEGGSQIQWLCPHKKRRRHRVTHREVGHEKMKAEIGVTTFSQRMSRIAGKHQQLEKRKNSPLEPLE